MIQPSPIQASPEAPKAERQHVLGNTALVASRTMFGTEDTVELLRSIDARLARLEALAERLAKGS